MVERCDGLRFTFESLRGRRAQSDIRPQDFERDRSLQGDLRRAIHDRHAAPRQLAFHFVFAVEDSPDAGQHRFGLFDLDDHRRGVGIDDLGPAVTAEPRRLRKLGAALEALHGFTRTCWRSVGKESV